MTPIASRVGDALVDEPADQLLGVAHLVADVGEVDVAVARRRRGLAARDSGVPHEPQSPRAV